MVKIHWAQLWEESLVVMLDTRPGACSSVRVHSGASALYTRGEKLVCAGEREREIKRTRRDSAKRKAESRSLI